VTRSVPRRLRLGILGVGALIVGACALPAPNSPAPTAAAGCPQEVIDRGAGWKEVGGPRAFVLACPVVADPVHPYKVMVRFEEGLERPFTIEGQLREGQLSEKGSLNWEIERRDWADGHGPPPNLSGSVHLVILRFPRPGCWEVTLSAGSELAGTAWIEVQKRSEQISSPATGSATPP
jgi:hypothetical protein